VPNEGEFFSTSRAAARLEMSPSSLREWGKLLAEAGYIQKGPASQKGAVEGAFQWTPEVIELIEFLEGVRQASLGRITRKEALAVLEQMGRKALELKRGRTYAVAISEAAESASSAARELEEAHVAFEDAVREGLQGLRAEVLEMVKTSGFSEVKRELEEAAKEVGDGRLSLQWARERLEGAAERVERLTGQIRFTAAVEVGSLLLGLGAFAFMALFLLPELWKQTSTSGGWLEHLRVFLKEAIYRFVPPMVLGGALAVLLFGYTEVDGRRR